MVLGLCKAKQRWVGGPALPTSARTEHTTVGQQRSRSDMGCCASSEALSAEHLASRVRTARTTRSLALKGAGLKAIPPQVLELGARLHVLDLSGNPGIDLSGLDQLTGLRKLAVASCGLVALPSLAPLTSLAELNASSNAIAIVGTLPPSVKVLALAFNGLRSLPPAVTCGSAIQVSRLQRLWP